MVQTASHKYKDHCFEKSIIDKLDLALEFILKLQQETRFQIYNTAESAQLNSQVQLDEKWASMINAYTAQNREPTQQVKALA